MAAVPLSKGTSWVFEGRRGANAIGPGASECLCPVEGLEAFDTTEGLGTTEGNPELSTLEKQVRMCIINDIEHGHIHYTCSI